MLPPFLEVLSKDLRDWINKQLAFLPSGSACIIEGMLQQIPTLPQLLRDLFDETYRSFSVLIREETPSILIAGPYGAGKSTLSLTLTGKEEAYFSTGSETFPSLQSVVQIPFLLLDLPTLNPSQTDLSLPSLAKQADFLLLLWDYQEISQIPLHPWVDQLLRQGKPFLWAVNKIDQGLPVPEEVKRIQQLLSCEPVFISAQQGTHLPHLLRRMVAIDPRLLNTFSLLRPEYRSALVRSRIVQAVGLAATIGWEPLPCADAIPLFFLQARMVLEIGRLYGFSITLERAWELIGVLTGGMVLREGFRQLSKLIPFAGNILSMAYAAAGTAAMGLTAQKWFEKGCQIPEKELQEIYQTAYQSYEKAFRALQPREGFTSQVEALLDRSS